MPHGFLERIQGQPHNARTPISFRRKVAPNKSLERENFRVVGTARLGDLLTDSQESAT